MHLKQVQIEALVKIQHLGAVFDPLPCFLTTEGSPCFSVLVSNLCSVCLLLSYCWCIQLNAPQSVTQSVTPVCQHQKTSLPRVQMVFAICSVTLSPHRHMSPLDRKDWFLKEATDESVIVRLVRGELSWLLSWNRSHSWEGLCQSLSAIDVSDKRIIRSSLGCSKSNPGLCRRLLLASKWWCRAVYSGLQKIINMVNVGSATSTTSQWMRQNKDTRMVTSHRDCVPSS